MAGIDRKVDSLGRVNIPRLWREETGTNGTITMQLEGNKIIIEAKVESCCICGKTTSLRLKAIKNKNICKSCMKEIKKY